MSYIFTNTERIEEIKEKISNDNRLKRELYDLAEQFLMQEPLSVTFHKSPAVSGNIHDYYSEGPYWWPDPENPDGPYIRRDGQHNPNRFNFHSADLSKMSTAVVVLCQAGVLLSDKKYFEKAMELVRVWFLDEETKMNPHLEYAQAIRGICDGRSIGIIDTYEFIKVVSGVNLIENEGLFTDEIAQLKEWFSEYATWLNTSKNGLEEKNYFNNHANWWNTQVASFTAFCGNEKLLDECFENYKNNIIVNQLDSEGKFIDEITRTRSYTYTIMNTEACAIICEIAYHRGIDLWNYEAENGNSLKKCVEFFKPYYDNPFIWKYEQINDSGAYGEKAPFKLAAMRFKDTELEAMNKKRSKDFIPCSQISKIGLIDLI